MWNTEAINLLKINSHTRLNKIISYNSLSGKGANSIGGTFLKACVNVAKITR